MPFQPNSRSSMVPRGERLRFKFVEDMAQYIASTDIALIDAVVCDPLGTWHHWTYAPSQCQAHDLKLGFAFDSSSVSLLGDMERSDMLMTPDPTTCWIDPFCKHRTLHVICNIVTPEGEPYRRCPRQLARRAARVVSDLGIGDYCLFGPEPEFFVFDHVRVNISEGEIAAEIDGEEAPWNNSGMQRHRRQLCARDATCLSDETRVNNLGGRLQKTRMYSPVTPTDTLAELRSDMLLTLRDIGVPIEKHHHESALCQVELGFRCGQLVETADHVMTCKYVAKNVARLHGKTATFMPKPIFGDNGSGFHINQSLWSQGSNLFFDPQGKGLSLSMTAMHYIAGILYHARALSAFTNPTTNSYKRLVPDFAAPCKLVYSQANRTAAIRIPITDPHNPRTKRLECRFPDGSCCPYLAFSALLLAGIDGILNKMQPPEPFESNVYLLCKEDGPLLPSTPSTLSEALDALEQDHDFLIRQNVFDEEFIRTFIAVKREEIRQVSSIPHPKEFELYYHI